MKTIIQTIGPLYGDDVNGTVFGQPNGSIATSPNNVYTISKSTDYVYVKGTSQNCRVCDSSQNNGVAAIIGFSLQSTAYRVVSLYTNQACTTRVPGTSGVQIGPPLQGGTVSIDMFAVLGFSGTIASGTKYYARVEFYLNGRSGLIATSEVIELEGI